MYTAFLLICLRLECIMVSVMTAEGQDIPTIAPMPKRGAGNCNSINCVYSMMRIKSKYIKRVTSDVDDVIFIAQLYPESSS